MTSAGNVTSNAITAGTISGSAFKLNNANALSHTGNVLYVGNANDWTTVELGRQTTDEIHVNGLLKAEQLLRAEQSAEITGSLTVSGSSLNLISGSLRVVSPTRGTMFNIDDNTFTLGPGASAGGGYTAVAIGHNASTGNNYSVSVGSGATTNANTYAIAIGGNAVSANGLGAIAIGGNGGGAGAYGVSIGYQSIGSGNYSINLGRSSRGTGANSVTFNTSGDTVAAPSNTRAFNLYLTDGTGNPDLVISASNASKLSGSSFTIEKSGSTVFEVIGSEGTLFSVDDDLDGTIFTANDRSGLPVLEASASGEVYIGKAPQSLYTTAVISSNNANVTQSIYGLDTSSYGGAFFEYTAHSGSNARAGSIMSVWNGSNINFTETTTTDIGSTSDLVMKVHISQSQAQLAAFSTNAGYNIKTIIKSI